MAQATSHHNQSYTNSLSITSHNRTEGITETAVEGFPATGSVIRMVSKNALVDIGWAPDFESMMVYAHSKDPGKRASLSIADFSPLVQSTGKMGFTDAVYRHEIELSAGGRGPSIAAFRVSEASSDDADEIDWNRETDALTITLKSPTQVCIPRATQAGGQ